VLPPSQSHSLPEGVERKAVEALAKARWEWMRIPEATPWESLHLSERKDQLRHEARRDLRAVFPEIEEATEAACRSKVVGEVKRALFSEDAVDAGDGSLMARSEVNPDRLVPDFESGLRAAWDEAMLGFGEPFLEERR